MDFPHGGDVYGNEILYDFSANINPLGMPEGVKSALKNSIGEWGKYPDPYCRKLAEKIAEHENFCAKNIVCGNGAADLIYRIVQAFAPKKSVICAPSFSEYEKALRGFGSEIITCRLREENEFLLGEEILEKLADDVDMLILCSPNNPTGKTIDVEILEMLCEKCLAENIIFLCDECFMDFVRDGKKKSAKNFLNPNIIILKAFTKIYAMAGLRLGYALFGSFGLAKRVREAGQFWSVSAPAQAAGIAALDEGNYIQKTLEIIEEERSFLSMELQNFGCKVYSSETNFILFRSGLLLDALLLKHRILIRNCANFIGLGKECPRAAADGSEKNSFRAENYFRVAVRGREENIALGNALKEVKAWQNRL